MERQKSLENKSILFLYLIYIVGIIGHLTDSLRPLMLDITPYTLLITGMLTFYFAYRESGWQVILWGITTFILTFAIEAIGVKTGLVFGAYSYGEVLGIKIFEVPLIIGFNWLLVILGAITIAEQVDQKPLLTALLTGTLAVVFDVFLEPVAMKLGYWSWEEGLIPLQNYYAWFGIAFAASLLLDVMKIKLSSLILEHYFIVQLLFFILLSIFM